jgi:hypothetical protein
MLTCSLITYTHGGMNTHWPALTRQCMLRALDAHRTPPAHCIPLTSLEFARSEWMPSSCIAAADQHTLATQSCAALQAMHNPLYTIKQEKTATTSELAVGCGRGWVRQRHEAWPHTPQYRPHTPHSVRVHDQPCMSTISHACPIGLSPCARTEACLPALARTHGCCPRAARVAELSLSLPSPTQPPLHLLLSPLQEHT